MDWIYPLILLTSIFSSGIEGSGIVAVRLETYINPGGKVDSRNCCDPGILQCSSRCDHKFQVCLNDPAKGDGCSAGEFSTEVIPDMNDIMFDGTPVAALNPFKLNFESWASTMDLKVTVQDYDEPTNSSQLVEVLQQPISVVPSILDTFTSVTIQQRTSIDLKIAVACDQHYYGPTCSIHCEPSDGPQGHYTCSPKGEKICRDGWRGENCLENTNECLSSPCVHGTCQDLNNAYKCTCEPGFLGSNCQEEADECHSAPCRNGGKCSDALNAFSCSCLAGFAGERCEVRTAPFACESNPCPNGATCVDVGASFKCECPVERKGKLCETWIPHICDEKPCQNGGTCIRMGGAFRCKCYEGYYDVRCNRKIGQAAKSAKYGSGATGAYGSMTFALIALPVYLMIQ